MTLNELLDLYFDHAPLRPASKRNYRSVARILRTDLGVDALPNRADQVTHWRDLVLERASPTTWNNYLRHMRAISRFAVSKGLIDTDVFREVRSVPAYVRKKKTVDENLLTRVFDLLKHDEVKPGWFWTFALEVLLYTGMRRRQLVKLTWPEVDLEEHLVTLSAAGSKTRREWQVPIAPRLASKLEHLREQTRKRKGTAYLAYGQVFNVTLFHERYRSKGETEASVEQVSAFFKQLTRKLGTNITPHRLRHTMATKLAPTGDIKTLQSILGHTDVRTTLEYVQPDMDDMRRLLDKLPEFGLSGPVK